MCNGFHEIGPRPAPPVVLRTYRSRSRIAPGQVTGTLLQKSLLTFLDLGLTPGEMSRVSGLPLAVIAMGLKRLDEPGQTDIPCCTSDHSWPSSRDETDHRIANSLQFAAAALRHQARRARTAADARAGLTEAAGRLNAIARVHRQLTRTAPDCNVDLARYLEPFGEDVAYGIGARLKVRAAGVTIPAETAGQICLVLNELAMNAVKHGGIPHGEPVVLTVGAARRGDGRVTIDVRDNGRGLPDGFRLDAPQSLGMRIVNSTVEKLGGDIRTLDGEGAGFRITIPVDGGTPAQTGSGA